MSNYSNNKTANVVETLFDFTIIYLLDILLFETLFD